VEKEGYLARKAERDKMRRSFASKQSSFAYAPTSEKIGMSLKIKQSTDLQQNNHKENKEHPLKSANSQTRREIAQSHPVVLLPARHRGLTL